MSATARLTDLKRKPLELVLSGIDAKEPSVSQLAGERLCREAKDYGLSLRDYLTLAVDVPNSTVEINGKLTNAFSLGEGKFMNGYDASLKHLNIPFKNDFKSGVLLQAANDTFQYKPGSKAFFPEVVDDMLQWTSKQDEFETTAGLVAQSRTVNGTQLITRAILSDKEEERHQSVIAEMANIPVQTLTDTEHSVKFFKFGSAIRTTYEFSRRVTLDYLLPYARRVERQKEIDKVRVATSMLINGDAVHSPAKAITLGSFGGDFSGTKTLQHNYKAFVKFLIRCARDGVRVDTVVGNLDMYCELLFMFTPTAVNKSEAEHLQMFGTPKIQLTLDVLQGAKFELSSTMPMGKLLVYTKFDTLEELNEAGSQINESEQAIRNQTITYVKTINHGYRLIYGDTRYILDCTQ